MAKNDATIDAAGLAAAVAAPHLVGEVLQLVEQPVTDHCACNSRARASRIECQFSWIASSWSRGFIYGYPADASSKFLGSQFPPNALSRRLISHAFAVFALKACDRWHGKLCTDLFDRMAAPFQAVRAWMKSAGRLPIKITVCMALSLDGFGRPRF